MAFPNPKTQANDYVRKHNPAVIYDSVTTVPNRLANIKNLTLFYEDLANNALPQWMFITPNMVSLIPITITRKLYNLDHTRQTMAMIPA